MPAIHSSGSYNGSTINQIDATSVAFNPVRMACQANTSTSLANFNLGVMAPSSKYVAMLASVFTQWRHTSDLRLYYEPGLNSDNSAQFFLQWVGDAANPSFGISATSSRVLIQTDIDDVPHVAMFAGWSPMCIDLPTSRDWKYSFTTPQYVVDGTSGGYAPAEVRDTSSGLLSIGNLRPDTSATYQTGLLFMEADLEFRDANPAFALLLLTTMQSTVARFDGSTLLSFEEKRGDSTEESKTAARPVAEDVSLSLASASAPTCVSDELSFDKDVALIASSPVLRRAFAVAAASSSSTPSVRVTK